MSTTKAERAVKAGLQRVSVKIQAYPEPVSMELYCEHIEEVAQLLQTYYANPIAGFKGKYFVLPPGVYVLLARLESVPALG